MAMAGLLLVPPFAALSALQLQTASQDVQAAERIEQSSSRLSTFVQLRPALNSELFATGIAFGASGPFGGVPSGEVLSEFGPEATLAEAQIRVDDLLVELNDQELAERLDQTREIVTVEPDSMVEATATYTGIGSEISAEIERELVRLNSAAGATDSVSVSEAAHLAAAAAELQATLVELDGLWALLESAAFLAPNVEDVPRFTSGILLFEEQAAFFDSLAPESGRIRQDWDALNNSAELDRQLAEFNTTADRLVTEGLAANTRTIDSELSGEEILEGLALVQRMRDMFNDSAAVNEQLASLTETTLAQLADSAQGSVSQADQRRQITIASLFAALFLLAAAAIGAVVLIGRPMRIMAAAANRMSKGDLDVELPETGPREIRVGAKAINDASASLRHVEAQAIAIAEQRLDDAILDKAAPGDLGLSLQIAVNRLADSVAERDEIHVKLEYEAGHDSLTKLANRRTLFEHLQNRHSDGQLFAVLLMDLDEFKSLNDTHGHQVGDEVLQSVANRIRGIVDNEALAARLGGDEFVVVTRNLASPEEALVIAQRVHNEVTRPIPLEDVEITPRASIGVALSETSTTPGALLRDADLALYRSKASPHVPIVVCDDTLRDAADRREQLVNSMMHGLERDEFSLVYQALVHADNAAVAHKEALIRWTPEGHDSVDPSEFVQIAERSDLIIDLDCWVLEEVAEQQSDTKFLRGERVAVNISARHLSSGRLAQNVKSIIDRHHFDPRRLIIEVTETAILHDLDTATQDLAALRSMGVLIALDDFGTGFMSLAYLRSLPVDILKIDRSFLEDIDSTEGSSIVDLITNTGHLLDLTIVAEGVETHEQANRLAQMGVDMLQGYLFGHPVALEDTDEPITALAA